MSLLAISAVAASFRSSTFELVSANAECVVADNIARVISDHFINKRFYAVVMCV